MMVPQQPREAVMVQSFFESCLFKSGVSTVAGVYVSGRAVVGEWRGLPKLAVGCSRSLLDAMGSQSRLLCVHALPSDHVLGAGLGMILRMGRGEALHAGSFHFNLYIHTFACAAYSLYFSSLLPMGTPLSQATSLGLCWA